MTTTSDAITRLMIDASEYPYYTMDEITGILQHMIEDKKTYKRSNGTSTPKDRILALRRLKDAIEQILDEV